MPAITSADVARFWSRVDKTGGLDACWFWKAAKKKNGYGQMSIGGKMVTTHRIAYTLANGSIPHDGTHHGICVCHRCDNPPCCNPAHLFLGTMADNVTDRDAKKRGGSMSGIPCRHLTPAQVTQIRNLYAKGVRQKEIALQIGVSLITIGRAIARKTYKQIP